MESRGRGSADGYQRGKLIAPGSLDGSQAAIPWRRIVRQLSLAYHWTPRQIAELTLRQVAIYLTDAPDPGSTASLSPSAGLSLSRQRRAEKAAWIEACLSSR